MVFGWGESHDAYQQVYEGDSKNESSFSHELVAGGAAFAGFKAFEDHQRKEGKPVNHAFAKELLAGFAAAEVDKLAETKGEDFVDRERAKHQAKKNAERMYDDHYGDKDQYDPNYDAPDRINRQFGGY
ncbi:putative antibiotic response protein [Botryosphaeria dothidea]|uniref:Antibiotic response protein n=1 Tax=Botryosphaeria dothidea TaxID=55169 RepID=A0A8H4MYH7_9PEZI|nr:putative antibiotic response protein [Botryosphaeria dothidea]